MHETDITQTGSKTDLASGSRTSPEFRALRQSGIELNLTCVVSRPQSNRSSYHMSCNDAKNGMRLR